MCTQEMSAQAMLPEMGTLLQGLAGCLRESFSKLSQPPSNCSRNCGIDNWELLKPNGVGNVVMG